MRLIKLSILFPSEHGERVSELLTSMTPAVDHFIMWKVEGNLEIGQRAKILEQVRGRLDQTLLMTILPEDYIKAILDLIRLELKSSNISHWTELIESYGQLTPENT